jgi:hypothetical protein
MSALGEPLEPSYFNWKGKTFDRSITHSFAIRPKEDHEDDTTHGYE